MNLTEEFVKKIELKILSGEWKMGDKIPPLRNLAQNFNVSRSVINAGIVELQNKGYILTVPRRCNVVADWKKKGTLAVLSGIIENELYDNEFISNVLESRKIIECGAVKRATERANQMDLDEIEKVTESERKAQTIEEMVSLDVQFHHSIVCASHNIIYPLMLKSFEDMIVRFVTIFYKNNGDREFIYDQHQKIYNAIKNHDPDGAEAAMEILLDQGAEVLNEYLKVGRNLYDQV